MTNSETTINNFIYDGKTKKLYGIWFVSLLLGIVTLGIYNFWGKTKMRKYIAGSIKLLQDRFEYTGTGMELFIGFLKALPVIIIFYAPIIILNPEKHPWVSIFILPLIYLGFVAIYGALKYRMSRTTWRGIRGKLTGSAFGYANLILVRMLINAATLGLLIHRSDTKLYKYVIDNSSFGSAELTFDKDPKPLFKINLITLLLAIPTVTLSRFWYRAALIRHLYNNTTIDSLNLKATHTGKTLLLLFLGNLLIFIFTLGFGLPIIIQRHMKYFANNVSIVGDIDTANIRQSDQELENSGEGLEGALGTDSGFM